MDQKGHQRTNKYLNVPIGMADNKILLWYNIGKAGGAILIGEGGG